MINCTCESDGAEEEDHEGYLSKTSTSSASFFISELKSIVFGPNVSRFWLYRKHINSMNINEIEKQNGKNLPFFSWECVTLQLAHRDVDLVIKDEENMNKLLTFLVYKLRTVDGERNSAIGI